jgi:hypothetical protein
MDVSDLSELRENGKCHGLGLIMPHGMLALPDRVERTGDELK